MAGISLGAFSPASPEPGAEVQRHRKEFPATTRTRRPHGVFMLGGELATVTSSRRQGDRLGVTLSLTISSMTLNSKMTPCQARAIARALHAAALAAETTQQRGAGRAALAEECKQ